MHRYANTCFAMMWTHNPSFSITMVDIDECMDSNGGCEYTCINTNGSYTCSCPDGFHLSPNGLNCTGMSISQGDMKASIMFLWQSL